MKIELKSIKYAAFASEETNGSVANSDTVSKIGLMYCQGQLR
jgi:hypothetical protein